VSLYGTSSSKVKVAILHKLAKTLNNLLVVKGRLPVGIIEELNSLVF